MDGGTGRALATGLGARSVLLTGGESMAEDGARYLRHGRGRAAHRGAARDDREYARDRLHLIVSHRRRVAKGETLDKAVKIAKLYVTAAIIAADELAVGKGRGPVHHFHALWEKP